MAKKSKSEPKPMIFNKPGGEGTVIIRSGCPECGLVNGHNGSCPHGNLAHQQRVSGG